MPNRKLVVPLILLIAVLSFVCIAQTDNSAFAASFYGRDDNVWSDGKTYAVRGLTADNFVGIYFSPGNLTQGTHTGSYCYRYGSLFYINNDNYKQVLKYTVTNGAIIISPAGSGINTFRLMFDVSYELYHNVTFNLAGGTHTGGGAVTQTISSGSSAVAPTATKTGYTLSGWDSNLTITSEITINALWQANTYTVKYNSNGGSGSMANTAMTYGISSALRANTFTKVGYRFKGWALGANGAVSYTNSQQVTNLTAVNNATVNLYAVWEYIPIVRTLSATIRPVNAKDKTVVWKLSWSPGSSRSSQPVGNYVSVTANGLVATLTNTSSFKGDSIVVTVTTSDGGYTDTCILSCTN